MTRHTKANLLRRCGLFMAALAAGCLTTPKAEEKPAADSPAATALPAVPAMPGFATALRPYVPASRPAEPMNDPLPEMPEDAKPSVPLRYTVELWEILMPRGSVSADAAFWKRVDEPATPEGQQLLKNGVRTGQLPLAEIDAFRKMIEDRGGKHTVYNGVTGKLIELSVQKNVPEQIVFYHNRDDELIGRSWEKCENLFYFSFESTPRDPDRVRISFTPAVRSNEKRLIYAALPGKPDRELQTVVEQSNYDVAVEADLPLDRMMVIAPSPEAQQPHTVGGIFLMESSPSQKQERVMLVIPHAYGLATR